LAELPLAADEVFLVVVFFFCTDVVEATFFALLCVAFFCAPIGEKALANASNMKIMRLIYSSCVL
jgi:hypothetical protein